MTLSSALSLARWPTLLGLLCNAMAVNRCMQAEGVPRICVLRRVEEHVARVACLNAARHCAPTCGDAKATPTSASTCSLACAGAFPQTGAGLYQTALAHPCLLPPHHTMGSSSSTPQYEGNLPALAPVYPTGVLAHYTAHTGQMELEFAPPSHGSTTSAIVDRATGAPVFTIKEKSSGKIVIGDGSFAENTLLNVYPAFWGGKWEIKDGGRAEKALIAKVKDVTRSGRTAFSINFANMARGEKCKMPAQWYLSFDEVSDGARLCNEACAESTDAPGPPVAPEHHHQQPGR